MTEAYDYTQSDNWLTVDGDDFDLTRVDCDQIQSLYQAEMLEIELQTQISDMELQSQHRSAPDNDGDTAQREFVDWKYRIRRRLLHYKANLKKVQSTKARLETPKRAYLQAKNKFDPVKLAE